MQQWGVRNVDLGAYPIFSITFVLFSLPALAVTSGSFSKLFLSPWKKLFLNSFCYH